MGVCANTVIGHKMQLYEDCVPLVGAYSDDFLAEFQQRMGTPITGRARHLRGDCLLLVFTGVDNFKATYLWRTVMGSSLPVVGRVRLLHGDSLLPVLSNDNSLADVQQRRLSVCANTVLGHKTQTHEDCFPSIGAYSNDSLVGFQRRMGTPITGHVRHLHGDCLLLFPTGVDNLKATCLWRTVIGSSLPVVGCVRLLQGDSLLSVLFGIHNFKAMCLWQMVSGARFPVGCKRLPHGYCLLVLLAGVDDFKALFLW
jgi:hypothetical protein